MVVTSPLAVALQNPAYRPAGIYLTLFHHIAFCPLALPTECRDRVVRGRSERVQTLLSLARPVRCARPGNFWTPAHPEACAFHHSL